jgi:predicted Zn-dependent protease
MKRWILLFMIFVAAGAALVFCERHKVAAPVGPQAFIYFVADSEREMTRLPVSFTRLSDADETKFGDELAKVYARHLGSTDKDADSRAIESYVQKVGTRVASGAHRKLPYRFHYIPDGTFINAFALPGGHVFIGKGLISLMTSEDELAAVLGHEIEHIDHYHCAERVQTEAALHKLPLGELIGIPVEVFEAGYTKDQELEADREGALLAARQGYSLQGALDMFETFERLFRERVQRAATPQEELSQVTIQSLQDYFRSHPATSERIAQIRDMISSGQGGSSTQVRDLEIAYIFKTAKADRAIAKGQFQIAAGLAAAALKQNPKYVPALRVEAEAQFALHNYQAAADTYRQLLDVDPASGQQAATFADKLAATALNQGDARLAAELASHVLDLQLNEQEALKILTVSKIELGEDEQAQEAYLRLKNLYPSQSGALIDAIVAAAHSFYTKGRYEGAARLLQGALALEPSHSEALDDLGDAQFALCKFSEAAQSYRALIEAELRRKTELDPELLTGYADALGSGDEARRGWVSFRELAPTLRSVSAQLATQADVELAGLRLVAGDDSLAKELEARAHSQTTQAIAPEALMRLGWWYYRAQNPAGAQALLADLARMRPANDELRNYQAWADLETQTPSAALEVFQQVPANVQCDDAVDNGPQMGRAVSLWRTGKQDEALAVFQVVAGSKPQWMNERWVKSIYTAGVSRTVGEMAGEYRKRQSARRRP